MSLKSVLPCAASALFFASAAAAMPIATYNFGSARFVEDPTRPIIYATMPASNSVAVIDANTLQITNTIGIGSNPNGLALSPDGSTLFVADSGSSFISRLNTQTLTVLPSLLSPGGSPSEIQVGNSNRLWVLGGGGIHQIDATTGVSSGPDLSQKEGMYPLLISGGDIKISPDKSLLYYGNSGLSPSNAWQYDVSTTSPQEKFVLGGGGNGQSIVLSHDGSMLSYFSAGDDSQGIYRTSDFATLGSFNKPSTNSAFSPDDKTVYTVHSTTHVVSKYDVTSFNQIPFGIQTADEPMRLFVDNTGNKLFVAERNGVEVFNIGRRPDLQAIYSTGVDDNGNTLNNGWVGDPHYALVSAPASSSKVTQVRNSMGGFPIGPWAADDDKSSWIGPNNDANLDGAPGRYDYRTTFQAPAGAGTVTITGTWAADDAAVDIAVNGISSGDSNTSSFDTLRTFTVTEPVIAGGLNTLDFLVDNGSSGGVNATGLRVEIASVTFSPEPASLSILATAIVLAAVRRRRRPPVTRA